MGFHGYNVPPPNASDAIKPWEVHIPQKDIDDLVALLKLTPLAPPTYENALPEQDGYLGLRRDWMVETKRYWESSFNWREQEKYINSFPHFKASIQDPVGDFEIHFVALFSKKADAIPILLLHGWPGCFIEFLSILDMLRERYTAETLPYHLIVPSLPGYTFSSPPPLDRNITSDDAARIFDKLTSLLGFESYIIQGGDLGGRIGRIIAANHPNCKAIHLNTGPMPPPEEAEVRSQINKTEEEGLQRHLFFKHNGSAYAWTHATRPSTIGFVLSSNPVALLAWVGEKFLDWTDDTPPLDLILVSITLYWVTHSAASSLWSYRQFYGPDAESHGTKRWHINKPLGFSWFPKEITPVPRAWVETTGDLVFYRQHKKGGHFAAMEQPEALWADVEDFLGILKDRFAMRSI
ncbi:Alpha/Beta hydrolase protein [Talaromyces proteolyticus]|uniref:Alpha/Beta hydrolase protein n=1 Tax=Talaromyces proteolyticus TaxID=1131652 RepID=A0AAD4PS46_9EURO|nr:Alpha/Beta hydrolase protein [Talaromyces proteolyticus]KAH8690457.1 Alpha/Beta hydrolase protein [Talaromyces proteolyticus]